MPVYLVSALWSRGRLIISNIPLSSAADKVLLSYGRPGLDSAELGGALKLSQFFIILRSTK